MMVYIFIGCLFLAAAALAFLFVSSFQARQEASKLEKRLDRLQGGGNVQTLEEAGLQLYPEDTRNPLEDFLPQLPKMSNLFEQADFKVKPDQFLMICGGVGLIGGTIVPLTGLPALGAIAGFVLFAPLPFLYVFYLKNQRLAKFEGQLGEALELVARALRAGHSLASGMHVVQEEMPDPISREFGRVYEEQNLGRPLEEAMRKLADRIPGNVDLRFFVTAVIIQRQTGGDLAEILDKIGYLIRERFKIRGSVQALTAEGRLSGVVLLALPILLFVVLLFINKPYVATLWQHPTGRIMSVCAIVSCMVGAYFINKIVDIKI